MNFSQSLSRRNFLHGAAATVATAAIGPALSVAQSGFASKRPAPSARRFRSKAVDAAIDSVSARMRDRELAWLFSNCLPNTLDTTVTSRHSQRT